MESAAAHLTVLVAGLASGAAVQAATCRFLARWSWLRTLLAGLVSGYAVTAAGEVLTMAAGRQPPATFLAHAAAVMLGYTGYSFFYYSFINGTKTALRVRILRELIAAPAGLSDREILEIYRPAEMFAARIGRLLAHGQVVLRDGRYYIGKPVLAVIANLVVLAKLTVIGKESEFD